MGTTPWAAAPGAQPIPSELRLDAGALTKYFPLASTKRNGFSRMRGVVATTVYAVAGHAPAGGRWAPTKTMFQLEPTQLAQSVFLDKNCCCVPEFTCPSILESAMN